MPQNLLDALVVIFVRQLPITLVISGIFTLYYILNWKQILAKYERQYGSKKTAKPIRHSHDPQIARLQKELAMLLHGDRNQAHRIVSNLRKAHPRKPARWLYEKAILDLERDRRA